MLFVVENVSDRDALTYDRAWFYGIGHHRASHTVKKLSENFTLSRGLYEVRTQLKPFFCVCRNMMKKVLVHIILKVTRFHEHCKHFGQKNMIEDEFMALVLSRHCREGEERGQGLSGNYAN